jgi:hypothetical protein
MWALCSNPPNTIGLSADGINWMVTNNATTVFTDISGARCIVWGGSSSLGNAGMWVAGGGGGIMGYSYDGIAWFLGVTTSAGFAGTAVHTIGWNGSIYLAGARNGVIASSQDGVNWLNTNVSIFNECNKVIWTGTQWLAGGSGPNVFAYTLGATGNIGPAIIPTSSGGQYGWYTSGYTSATNSFGNWLKTNTVACNGSQCIVGGNISNTYVTALPISNSANILLPITTPIWQVSNGPGEVWRSTNMIAWNGYQWIMAAKGSSRLYCSIDGVTWTYATSPSNSAPLAANLTDIYALASRRVLPYIGINIYLSYTPSNVSNWPRNLGLGTGATITGPNNTLIPVVTGPAGPVTIAQALDAIANYLRYNDRSGFWLNP